MRQRCKTSTFATSSSVVSPKWLVFCCPQVGLWRGARREHPPKWGCDRGATKPEPKSDATLRATVLFGPDVVAHSLQTPEGYALVPVRKHLAPRLGQKSLAANVVVFMEWGTKGQGFPLERIGFSPKRVRVSPTFTAGASWSEITVRYFVKRKNRSTNKRQERSTKSGQHACGHACRERKQI